MEGASHFRTHGSETLQKTVTTQPMLLCPKLRQVGWFQIEQVGVGTACFGEISANQFPRMRLHMLAPKPDNPVRTVSRAQ